MSLLPVDPTGEEIERLTKPHLINIIRSLDHTGSGLKHILKVLGEMKKGPDETEQAYLEKISIKLLEAKNILDYMPKTIEGFTPTTNPGKSSKLNAKSVEATHYDANGDEEPMDTSNTIKGNFKLDSNTPIFGEKKTDNVDDWIFSVNNSMFAANIPKNLKLSAVTPYLRGLPLLTLKRYQQTNGIDGSWEGFCGVLLNQFKPRDWQNKLRLQLRDLKQTDSFEGYLLKFQSLITQINDLQESDKILWFTEGLLPKTKFEVKSKHCSTLEEAIQIASTYDSCFRSNQVGVNYTNKVNHGRHLTSGQWQGHSSGHSNGQRSGQFSGQFSGQRSGQSSGHRNGQYNGQWSTQSGYSNQNNLRGNLYRSKSANSLNRRNNPEFNNGKNKEVKCYKCNRTGHYANECKMNVNNKSILKNNKTPVVAMCEKTNESILKIDGQINGKKALCALDIGAVESIISKKWVEFNNIPINESDVQVKQRLMK